MAWSGKATFTIFQIVLFFSVVFMLAHIILISLYYKDELTVEFTGPYLYMLATTYGTGFGCVWLRLRHAKTTLEHAIVHTLVFAVMLAGHRDILIKLFSSDIKNMFKTYCLNVVTLFVYFLQYLLSFHFVVFRWGRTPEAKAFRAGLHAYLGALTFFLCLMDGYITTFQLMEEKGADSNTPFIAGVCLLLYGVCTWYLMLNPYFDWRRLNALARTSKRNSSRTSIKSSRSSSRTSRRSSHKASPPASSRIKQ